MGYSPETTYSLVIPLYLEELYSVADLWITGKVLLSTRAFPLKKEEIKQAETGEQTDPRDFCQNLVFWLVCTNTVFMHQKTLLTNKKNLGLA